MHPYSLNGISGCFLCHPLAKNLGYFCNYFQKKNQNYMITVGLHQRHRLTETNRQTDRQISCDSIVRTMLGWRTSCNGSWTPQHVSSATHGSLTTVWRTFDVIFCTGWMYQNASHSSYAWPSTTVCTEWDRYICRRCAGRARRRLVVVNCVLLTVVNSSFTATG